MNVETLSVLADKNIQLADGEFKTFREKHLESFKLNGFKTADPDFYKFTKLEGFLETLSYSPKNIEVDLSRLENQEIPTLFIRDGVLESQDLKIPGVKVSSLKESHFKDLTLRKNALTDLHHSFLSEGVVITIEKNTVLEKPLRVIFLTTKESVSAPTLVVHAGTHSKAHIIEETLSEVSHGMVVTESYFNVSAGANIEHVQLGLGSENFLRHGSTYTDIHKDAVYRNFVFHLSGKLNRQNLDMRIKDPGAHAESFNLYLTALNEHSDINTVIDHLAPDTTSAQIAKGILSDESKGIFTGKIHIHPDAQRVNSSQLNKNLLLSKKAQAHSQPQLEIFADDVKCSHGSTTGQLSPEELFYFEARGIPSNKARTLLAHGFGLEIVLKIENKTIRELISSLVLEKLKLKFNLGGIHE